MIVLLLVLGALANKLLQAEISATQQLISTLEAKEAELVRLKSYLTPDQLAELSEHNWELYQDQERRAAVDTEFLRSMTFRYQLELTAAAVSLDFVTLRRSASVLSPSNAGLLLCFLDKFEVYDITGSLLAAAGGFTDIQHCASLTTAEGKL
jgi:hypothetical protein